jgi:hypothetical protein
LQALGFRVYPLPQVAIGMPTKTPRGQELPREEKLAHHALHARRFRSEHVHSRGKRCRLGKDRRRLGQAGGRELGLARCGALPPCRVRWPPGQPLMSSG